jgi:hypothetical protein
MLGRGSYSTARHDAGHSSAVSDVSARGTLPGLCGLPDELLIRLAKCVITSAATSEIDLMRRHSRQMRTSLLGLVAVCRRLRTLFLRTPELWARIDLAWTQPCVDGFLARAQSAAIVVEIASREPPSLDRVDSALFSGAHAVFAYQNEDVLDDILRALEHADTQALWALYLHRDVLSESYCQHFTLPACASLRTLTVARVEVKAALPHLPVLRHLQLINTETPLETLAETIRALPCLKSIALEIAVDESRPLTRHALASVAAPAALPHLQRLLITDDLPRVAALFALLPCPRTALQVYVCCGDPDNSTAAWPSPLAPHEAITSWIAQFCASAVFGSTRVPRAQPATLSCTSRREDDARWDDEPCLAFRKPARGRIDFWADEPSMLYANKLGTRADADGPLLAHAGALSVDLFKDAEILLHLAHCTRVEQVNLCGATTVLAEEHGAALEEWLRARHEHGRPLRAVRFRACAPAAKAFCHRLEKAGLAGEIVWEERNPDAEDEFDWWNKERDTAEWMGCM